jgi:hypothetical protein
MNKIKVGDIVKAVCDVNYIKKGDTGLVIEIFNCDSRNNLSNICKQCPGKVSLKTMETGRSYYRDCFGYSQYLWVNDKITNWRDVICNYTK